MMTRRLLSVLLATLFAILIFGARKMERDTIKFDHNLHVNDNGIACMDCHSGMDKMGLNKSAMPDHAACATCHDVEDKAGCVTCHTNPANPTKIASVSNAFTNFAHANHAGKNCTECHAFEKAGAAKLTIPAINDCQSCHASAKVLPLDHKTGTWKTDHGLEASFAVNNCAACHTETSCDKCHEGSPAFGMGNSPHPPTWRFNHGIEAVDAGECMACHESNTASLGTSCTNCHRSMIPIPHPLGPMFANNIDGGEHVEEANSFFESCLSCHDMEKTEPTCARCHK